MPQKVILTLCDKTLQLTLEYLNEVIGHIVLNQRPTDEILHFALMELGTIRRGHESLIKDFLNEQYEPPPHIFNEQYIKAKGNYLFRLLRLCQEVYNTACIKVDESTFVKRCGVKSNQQIRFQSIVNSYNNFILWYEYILKEQIVSAIFEGQYLYKRCLAGNRLNKKEYLDLIRRENKILKDHCGEGSRPSSIYKSEYFSYTHIRWLIEASQHLFFSKDQSESEFYKNYYRPFYKARDKMNKVGYEELQVYFFKGEELKIPQGSGHHSITVNLDHVLKVPIVDDL